METLKKLILPFIFFNLLVLDAGVVYFFLKTGTTSELRSSPPTVGGDRGVVQQNLDVCGTSCQKYITDQVAQIKLPTPLPTSKAIVVVAPTVAKTLSVAYVPVPGSGNTTANNWVDLPGTDFYFNVSNYSGLQSIYFETNIHLVNGNGQAFVRLFDVAHGIGVQGSEASTMNQSSTAIDSGQVSFYQGNNLYRVQAKSLTADTAIFDSGRLKITTKN